MSGLMASSAAILPSKNIANGLSGSANPVKIARFSDRSPNHVRREGWLGYHAVKADRLPGRAARILVALRKRDAAEGAKSG
jgi:hypothetical protein